MLSLYAGYGKSIPVETTLATSAPRPPVGPPPAVGAGSAVLVTGGVGVGVDFTGACFVGFTGVFTGAGVFFATGFGGATGAGFSTIGSGFGCTTPIARSP